MRQDRNSPDVGCVVGSDEDVETDTHQLGRGEQHILVFP